MAGGRTVAALDPEIALDLYRSRKLSGDEGRVDHRQRARVPNR
jgi:hypothetical protein